MQMKYYLEKALVNEAKITGTVELAKKIIDKLAEVKMIASKFDTGVGGIDRKTKMDIQDLIADAIEIVKGIK